MTIICHKSPYSTVVDNVSESSLSQQVEADVSAGNLSREVEVNEINSDEEIEQNDDVFWLRANTTPVACCNSEVPEYVGTS